MNTRRNRSTFNLLPIIYIPRLATGPGRELPVTIRLGDGLSAMFATTIAGVDLIAMILIDSQQEDDDQAPNPKAIDIDAHDLARLTEEVWDHVQHLPDDREMTLDIIDSQLVIEVEGRRWSVSGLPGDPIDRRSEIVQALTTPRVPFDEVEFPPVIIETLKLMAGVDELHLEALVTEDLADLDDDNLVEAMKRLPHLHWSPYLAVILRPVGDR